MGYIPSVAQNRRSHDTLACHGLKPNDKIHFKKKKKRNGKRPSTSKGRRKDRGNIYKGRYTTARLFSLEIIIIIIKK